MPNPLIELASAVTATGAQLGSSIQPRSSISVVQPIQCFIRSKLITTSGAGTATVTIETSVDNSSWTANVMTIGLSGALADSKQNVGVIATPFVRVNVTAISGTGAAVTVLLEYVPPIRV